MRSLAAAVGDRMIYPEQSAVADHGVG